MVEYIVERKSEKLAEEDYYFSQSFEYEPVSIISNGRFNTILEYRLGSESYTAKMSDVVVNFIREGYLTDEEGYKIITDTIRQSTKIRSDQIEEADVLGVYNNDDSEWLYIQPTNNIGAEARKELILENGIDFIKAYLENEYQI